MPTPLITTDGVCYAYDAQDTQSVRNVSLAIHEGEFVCVLGHNGSGKSTLAKLLNAIYQPTEGSVTVCGMDSTDEDKLFDIRQTVGMVFQNPDNQLVATVVEEDVAFGLENIGVPTPEIRPRVEEALRAVGMEAFSQHAPHMLSGGQKQRIAVAGILAMRPRVIILDESTAMLDPQGRRDVFATVRALNREAGITVVWITHFMEEAALSDRLIIMHEGNIAMEGTPRALFARVNEIRALGLDVPPMTALSHDLIADGISLPSDILTIDEMVEALCQLSSKI